MTEDGEEWLDAELTVHVSYRAADAGRAQKWVGDLADRIMRGSADLPWDVDYSATLLAAGAGDPDETDAVLARVKALARERQGLDAALDRALHSIGQQP